MTHSEVPVILVVDDTETNIDVLVELFSGQYEVSVAMDGESAIETASEDQPDIILLDIMMPGMDGYEVCRRLKNDVLTRDIPVIFVTAKTAVEDETKGLALGAVDYITKPISPPLVFARVRTHLALSQAHRSLAQQNDALASQLDRLLFERQFIEDVMLRIRATERFDSQNLRFLVESVEKTTGDLLLSGRRPDAGQNILVGDFTGHGLQAAIGSPTVSGSFYDMTEKGLHMPAILKEINRKLQEILPWGTYLAACGIELDANHSRCLLWNGGMPDILLFRKGRLHATIPSARHALGVSKDALFNSGMTEIVFEPQDRMFVHSDGVLDVLNPQGEHFGEQRLEQSVLHILSAGSSLEMLREELERFRNGCESVDDITLVEISHKSDNL